MRKIHSNHPANIDYDQMQAILNRGRQERSEAIRSAFKSLWRTLRTAYEQSDEKPHPTPATPTAA